MAADTSDGIQAEGMRSWAAFLDDHPSIPTPHIELRWHLHKTSPKDSAALLDALELRALRRLGDDAYIGERTAEGVHITVFLSREIVDAAAAAPVTRPEFADFQVQMGQR